MRRLTDNEIHSLGFDPTLFDRMYGMTETNSVVRYVKGIYSGFISHGKVITEPLFIPCARIIDEDYIITNFFKSPYSFYNNTALLDANTGEQLITNFGAYFIKGHYFTFRVNGPSMAAHRWGVYSLAEHKLIQQPIIEYQNIYQLVNSFLGIYE